MPRPRPRNSRRAYKRYYALPGTDRLFDNIVTQDESARNAAKHAIEDSSEKIDKTKRELEKHENELAEAERALEEIRDSLKGKQCRDSMPPSI